MKIILAPRARKQLANQMRYLVDQHAHDAARKFERTISNFLKGTVALYPASGTYLTHRELWERAVPQSHFVVWYRFTREEIEVVRVWHSSQNRYS